MDTALAAAEGFALGASLIIAIGAQNAFVLRQGLARAHVFLVAGLCSLADAGLIALGACSRIGFVEPAVRLLVASNQHVLATSDDGEDVVVFGAPIAGEPVHWDSVRP